MVNIEIVCPGCGFFMMDNDEKTEVWCKVNKCKYKDIKYHYPKVKLNEMPILFKRN